MQIYRIFAYFEIYVVTVIACPALATHHLYTIANNINKADEGKIIAEGLRSIHASEKWYTRHDISLQNEAKWWKVLIDRNNNGERFLTENLQIFITTTKNAVEIAEEKLLSHYNSLDF